MNLSIETVVTLLSIVGALAAIIVSLQANNYARRTATREAAEEVFEKWWGEDVRNLRLYFFLEFVPQYRVLLNGKGMREIESVVPSDHGRARQLCYYFDKVGWLCASGLLDTDYVLGPMQHALRRTWIVMEPLIVRERELGTERGSDPVYQLGFEWLFDRSSTRANDQASLVARTIYRKGLFGWRRTRTMRKQIDESEAKFCRELLALGIPVPADSRIREPAK